MYKVMLVDDEDDLREAVARIVAWGGYSFCSAADAYEGLEMLGAERPDLLLLDVMLPGVNGFDLCERIRRDGWDIPVIFLSAKGDIVDKSIGFKAGCDDYVTKPFDPTELMLRIEANIRRHKNPASRARESQVSEKGTVVGDLRIDFESYQAFKRGELLPLTTKEFEILAYLAQTPGKVVSRAEIQEHIWGPEEACIQTNSITVFVRKIRKKIEDDPAEPRYLQTVQRIGYRLCG